MQLWGPGFLQREQHFYESRFQEMGWTNFSTGTKRFRYREIPLYSKLKLLNPIHLWIIHKKRFCFFQEQITAKEGLLDPYHVSLPSKGSVLKKSDVSSDLPEKITTSESEQHPSSHKWLPSLQSRRTKEIQDPLFRSLKDSSFFAQGQGLCFFTFFDVDLRLSIGVSGKEKIMTLSALKLNAYSSAPK
ncbi:hypothetical protein AVEN_221240-1 [Araneus ventricosus]|uniref:Uncharacterized protein n=1 Tax=Araneus ventricosus TaxID=182803 RepID=A0A4Y2F677_ARAVE|nr:hypothetical protein AVEN_221240-1 [Araneus ventricosus]